MTAFDAIIKLKAGGWLTSQLAAAVGVAPSTMARWADGYPCRISSRLEALIGVEPPPNTQGRPIGSKNQAKAAIWQKEEKQMKMSRSWAMPNHNTFSIKPIKEMIARVIEAEPINLRTHGGICYQRGLWLDPFSRNSPFLGTIRNDLSTEFDADYHEEALTFLERFKGAEVDGVLFDPPYSPRQISECYKHIGRRVHTEDTQSSFYGDRKKAAAAALKIGGIAICFGWNSGGFGKTLGFELEEVLLVAHGGAHNDTIVTVERKKNK